MNSIENQIHKILGDQKEAPQGPGKIETSATHERLDTREEELFELKNLLDKVHANSITTEEFERFKELTKKYEHDYQKVV